MAAKGKAFALVAAAIALFVTPAAVASIPRITILDPQPIDRSELDDRQDGHIEVASIDNVRLLHRALARALPASAPVASLSETRVWGSTVDVRLAHQVERPLSRALRKASAASWAEIASDRTVLSPDPLGYGASGSNLYSFAFGDPVNGRDPTGMLCETANASGVWDWLQRCSQDALNVQQAFGEQIVFHPVKTAGRSVAGVVGTAKMIGKTVVGVAEIVADQQMAQTGDINAMMRQGQRVMAIASAVRHPIATVVDAHTRAADSILAAEQSGHWFRASVEAGEIGSADAAAVVGGVESGVALARLGTRLLARGATATAGVAFDAAPAGLAEDMIFDANLNRFRSTVTGRFVSKQTALQDVTVSRVFGGEARPFGRSFTVGDLNQFANVRKSLGIFPQNEGRFFIEGQITDFTGVRVRQALPGPLGAADALEVLIPNAERQIRVLRAGGVNPPF